jgi:hypothetical protein
MSNSELVKKNTIRRFFPLPSIIASAIIIFLVFAFFSGLSFQFYASVLFIFYAMTGKMWVSVVFLGVFQTILMIPLRIVRIIRSQNIKEFQRGVEDLKDGNAKQLSFKENFQKGNKTFLFYIVDFVIQLVSFITIGRMFLTDFYSVPISMSRLYSFVPYPSYPIQDTFFKIPYPRVVASTDLGLKAFLIIALVLVVGQVFILILRSIYRKSLKENKQKSVIPQTFSRYTSGYLVIILVVVYFLTRHFPTNLEIGFFSGDVSIPNRALNAITALTTFVIVMWFGVVRNTRQARLAEKSGIPSKVIEKIQKEMFKDSLKNSVLLGLGAFFITNQIPSAFELSIFTLEIISLSSPFTLDRIILGFSARKRKELVKNIAPDEA